jgi:hypothetical protein
MDDDTIDFNILTNEASDEALEAAAQPEREAWALPNLKFSYIPGTASPTIGGGCCPGASQ